MEGLKFIPSWIASLINQIAAAVGVAIPFNDCRSLAWFTKTTGTVTGGSIIIEWAPEQDYAGAWRQLAVINVANVILGTDGAGRVDGPIGFVRARIPAAGDITGGGSVTVVFNGLLK